MASSHNYIFNIVLKKVNSLSLIINTIRLVSKLIISKGLKFSLA